MNENTPFFLKDKRSDFHNILKIKYRIRLKLKSKMEIYLSRIRYLKF